MSDSDFKKKWKLWNPKKLLKDQDKLKIKNSDLNLNKNLFYNLKKNKYKNKFLKKNKYFKKNKELLEKSFKKKKIQKKFLKYLKIKKKNQYILRKILSEFKLSLDLLDSNISKKIACISLKIAARIIKSQPVIKKSILLFNVKKILRDNFDGLRKIKLFIHKEDKKLISKTFKKILLQYNCKIIIDNSVLPGGCRISFNKSFFNANIPFSWNEMCKLLFLEDYL
ncbi:MAG: hypothetical protein G8D24_01640 [Buchnera aphidicola (Periphyllus lyropictus)]|uniref:FliH/SctL family protein n=1 Tax=Buchnera aphidicola TaxID=9 RepID=UPI001ED0E420|nr:FliH/SctL family protein [Buchnera aphidicola]NIH16751.1 hypothetical protein [Buchnera aphidicola (Periphyllus lyropictus)]USS94652.1 flagellar assembly protein FliH [Buchnera aphidicola (Periphyllus lyropictus)]